MNRPRQTPPDYENALLHFSLTTAAPCCTIELPVPLRAVAFLPKGAVVQSLGAPFSRVRCYRLLNEQRT
jgi:hypothetical protein